jgi:hypothetical protein
VLRRYRTRAEIENEGRTWLIANGQYALFAGDRLVAILAPDLAEYLETYLNTALRAAREQAGQ